jgi:hypothetical protein
MTTVEYFIVSPIVTFEVAKLVLLAIYVWRTP